MEVIIKHNFPDSFVFPKNFDLSVKACIGCRFCVDDDWDGHCFITCSSDAPCPFASGEKVIELPPEQYDDF